jgi:hypothetical protein
MSSPMYTPRVDDALCAFFKSNANAVLGVFRCGDGVRMYTISCELRLLSIARRVVGGAV